MILQRPNSDEVSYGSLVGRTRSLFTPRKDMKEKAPYMQIPDPKEESTGRVIRSGLGNSATKPISGGDVTYYYSARGYIRN